MLHSVKLTGSNLERVKTIMKKMSFNAMLYCYSVIVLFLIFYCIIMSRCGTVAEFANLSQCSPHLLSWVSSANQWGTAVFCICVEEPYIDTAQLPSLSWQRECPQAQSPNISECALLVLDNGKA